MRQVYLLSKLRKGTHYVIERDDGIQVAGSFEKIESGYAIFSTDLGLFKIFSAEICSAWYRIYER